MSAVTVFKNCRLIDPSQGKDGPGELWVCGDRIVTKGSVEGQDATIIDLKGCWLVPGLIDMHVHLREPGEEYKESIESGTRAAAAGGFTAVACMPNTKPVNDTGSVTSFIREKARGCDARVYPVGAISKQLEGRSLAEFGELKFTGAVAVTDDGLPVLESQLMRRAMEYARSHNLLVISHCEDLSLSSSGCMNEGAVSTRMGLQGIPAAAESIMVQRDIALAELTGGRLHLAHISTAQSVEAIRAAKATGLKVSAETAPHYFSLTELAVSGYDTNAKMNPPLRSERDREAIIAALQDGTIDAIATDHAPHSILEKEVEFAQAANGIAGLETSLPLGLALVRKGLLSPSRLLELMSCTPAEILGVEGGNLRVGSLADITVIDPELRFVFSANESHSKGKNSPFDGWEMQGKAVLTMVGGIIRFRDL